MVLSEIIAELDRELAGRGSYKVAVLTRQRTESTSKWGDIESFPVLDVALDEHDSHVDILTGKDPEDPTEPSTTMNSEQLLQRLRRLEPRCAGWSVYVGSVPHPVNGDWGVRIDAPVVGIGTKHDDHAVGLLQFPPEQWSDAV
jgi:hypothetical protein